MTPSTSQVQSTGGILSPQDTISAASGPNEDNRGGKAKRVKPNSGWFETRCVASDPVDGKSHVELLTMIRNLDEFKSVKYNEKNWTDDRIKSCGMPESHFQHTLMMKAIKRHAIQEPLDYSCDVVWKCKQLPIRPLPNYKMDRIPEITMPKPDLVVSFKKSRFLEQEEYAEVSQLMEYMSPEAGTNARVRAFPFFIVEVKGNLGRYSEHGATVQAIHCASIALQNMWQFFKGGKYEKNFFDTVKVFSAIGYSRLFRIMMHWATPFHDEKTSECQLFFRHTHVQSFEGNEISKRNLQGTISNIFNWATDTLAPTIRDAVDELRERIAKPPTEKSGGKRRAGSQIAEDAEEQTPKRHATDSQMSAGPSTGASQQLEHATLEDDDYAYEDDITT